MNCSINNINQLPVEVIAIFLKYLTPKDFITAKKVCGLWYELTKTTSLFHQHKYIYKIVDDSNKSMHELTNTLRVGKHQITANKIISLQYADPFLLHFTGKYFIQFNQFNGVVSYFTQHQPNETFRLQFDRFNFEHVILSKNFVAVSLDTREIHILDLDEGYSKITRVFEHQHRNMRGLENTIYMLTERGIEKWNWITDELTVLDDKTVNFLLLDNRFLNASQNDPEIQLRTELFWDLDNPNPSPIIMSFATPKNTYKIGFKNRGDFSIIQYNHSLCVLNMKSQHYEIFSFNNTDSCEIVNQYLILSTKEKIEIINNATGKHHEIPKKNSLYLKKMGCLVFGFSLLGQVCLIDYENAKIERLIPKCKRNSEVFINSTSITRLTHQTIEIWSLDTLHPKSKKRRAIETILNLIPFNKNEEI